jgi:hypothetical protein
VKRLTAEVASCEVLIAVIGPRWLEIRNEHNERRIDQPNDFVRIEIAAALQRDIPVIPALVDGAKIPPQDLLPENIKDLAERNGTELRHASFHVDADRLIRELHKILAPSIPSSPIPPADETKPSAEAADVQTQAPRPQAASPSRPTVDTAPTSPLPGARKIDISDREVSKAAPPTRSTAMLWQVFVALAVMGAATFVISRQDPTPFTFEASPFTMTYGWDSGPARIIKTFVKLDAIAARAELGEGFQCSPSVKTNLKRYSTGKIAASSELTFSIGADDDISSMTLDLFCEGPRSQRTDTTDLKAKP